MTLLDMLVLFVLFIGLWQGFNNGLMRSLVGMFGWLLALLLASYLAKPLAPFFVSFTGSTGLSIIAAFLAIGLFVIVGLQIVLWVMSKTLQGLRLSILDKLAGAGFGLVKNLVIVLMVLSLLAPFVGQRDFWQQSKFANALLPLAPFATQITQQLATTLGKTAADKMGQMGQ